MTDNNDDNLSVEEAAILAAFECGEHVSMLTPERRAELIEMAQSMSLKTDAE